jgi:two-component system response regulator FlrC
MAIAILDPDKETVNIMAALVEEMGHHPAPFTDKEKFLGAINPKSHAVAIIADDFLEVIEGTKMVYPEIEIVAIGQRDALECTKVGASHFLKKPFKAEELQEVLKVLLNLSKSQRFQELRSIVIADPKMKQIMEMIDRVAPTQSPIFIQGESGTGKEVIARYIHSKSKRAGGPYMGINLAAIPDTLLESELFGFEKGAFTGAYATRIGRFELSDHGTILLDEITEISLGLQAKLLRVLQERQIDRVGGKEPISLDFRVIATTNKDIDKLIREGHFRKDLYYRLNVIPVKVPPLRSRMEDIFPLAIYFIKKVAKREGLREKKMGEQAKNALLKYSWPGNVRELENIIERAMILSDGDEILPEIIRSGMEEIPLGDFPLPGTTIPEMERHLIISTLGSAGGNRTKAAELLGISIRTLRNKLNEYKTSGQFSDIPMVKTPGNHG